MSKYYVRIADVRKVDFGCYGNECEYDVEVFNSQKKRIGRIEDINVVQQGTNYDSVYEELNYLCEEDDREALAEQLGVDEVPDEWFDEDGFIDAANLPESVNDYICEGSDQMLLDYYITEDFADYEEEDGLIPIETFADHLTFGQVGKFREIDVSLPLKDMFDKVYGSFLPDVWTPGEGYVPFDIMSSEGCAVFARLAAVVSQYLEDCDYMTSMVEIRYDGDYNMEAKAKEVMDYTSVEIAYIILHSLLPQIDDSSAEAWKRALNDVISYIGQRLGFIEEYDEPEYDELCSEVHDALKCDKWPSCIAELDEFAGLVFALQEKKIYPMPDEKYAELIDDRGLDFLKYCIG